MPYNETIAERLRDVLRQRVEIREQRMFGGLCFMLNGNMLCGVHRETLMFRVGKEQEATALARPGARPMDITGRPMAGFVLVDPKACDKNALRTWVALAENYAGTLPHKAASAAARPKK